MGITYFYNAEFDAAPLMGEKPARLSIPILLPIVRFELKAIQYRTKDFVFHFRL
jgi:hypothetical protein